jgi:hypothetical protein
MTTVPKWRSRSTARMWRTASKAFLLTGFGVQQVLVESGYELRASAHADRVELRVVDHGKGSGRRVTVAIFLPVAGWMVGFCSWSPMRTPVGSVM